MGTKFKNPSNDYVEEASSIAWLWALLFGPLYFGIKGVWPHALGSLILALVTFGISHFVYCFFANSIIRKSYLKKGWIQVSNDMEEISVEMDTQNKKKINLTMDRIIFFVILGVLIVIGIMSVASADVKSVDENISILKSTNSCEKCNLIGADFSEVDLSGVNLSGSSLSGANFIGANLTGAKFINANLTSAKFTNANLTGANFANASIHYAKFISTKLNGAVFSKASLMRANLSGSDLSGADLSEANLLGADLRRTNLTEVNFSGVDLENTKLNGADLTDANLTDAINYNSDVTKSTNVVETSSSSSSSSSSSKINKTIGDSTKYSICYGQMTKAHKARGFHDRNRVASIEAKEIFCSAYSRGEISSYEGKQ